MWANNPLIYLIVIFFALGFHSYCHFAADRSMTTNAYLANALISLSFLLTLILVA